MKPLISKYRQKVLDRQPPTLLGQRLKEAIKANGPSAANTRPVNFVNPHTKGSITDEQYHT